MKADPSAANTTEWRRPLLCCTLAATLIYFFAFRNRRGRFSNLEPV